MFLFWFVSFPYFLVFIFLSHTYKKFVIRMRIDYCFLFDLYGHNIRNSNRYDRVDSFLLWFLLLFVIALLVASNLILLVILL